MLQTETGTQQLDQMINSDTRVNLSLSDEVRITRNEETGRTVVRYGETAITSYERNADETYSANEANVTIFEGTINVIVSQERQLSGDAGQKQQMGVEGSIGAVGTHESVHAVDPANVNQNLKNQLEGENNNIEQRPKQLEQQYQDEY
jgi:hypothetical protein